MLKNIIITTMLFIATICTFATTPVIGIPFSSIACNKATISTKVDLESYINQNKNSANGELNGNFVRHGSAYVPDEFIFEGSFTPRIEGVQLALFSDDGVTVWTRLQPSTDWGNPIFTFHGSGQALPNLSQSLQLVTGSWVKDSTYDIKIEYSNISHPTWADIDGITAYFYNGTVDIPVVPKDPIPTSIVLSVDDESKNTLYQGGTKNVVIHSILDIDGAGNFTKDFIIDIYNSTGVIIASKNVAYKTNTLNYLNDFTVTLPDAIGTYSYYAKVTYQYFDTSAYITATDSITSNTIDVIYYDVLIQVRPKRYDGTGAWSDYAAICAGGIDTNAHKADVKIYTSPVVKGVIVGLSTLGGEGTNKDAFVDIGDITDENGEVFGIMTSSNSVGSILLSTIGDNAFVVFEEPEISVYNTNSYDETSYYSYIWFTHHGEDVYDHNFTFYSDTFGYYSYSEELDQLIIENIDDRCMIWDYNLLYILKIPNDINFDNYNILFYDTTLEKDLNYVFNTYNPPPCSNIVTIHAYDNINNRIDYNVNIILKRISDNCVLEYPCNDKKTRYIMLSDTWGIKRGDVIVKNNGIFSIEYRLNFLQICELDVVAPDPFKKYRYKIKSPGSLFDNVRLTITNRDGWLLITPDDNSNKPLEYIIFRNANNYGFTNGSVVFLNKNNVWEESYKIISTQLTQIIGFNIPGNIPPNDQCEELFNRNMLPSGTNTTDLIAADLRTPGNYPSPGGLIYQVGPQAACKEKDTYVHIAKHLRPNPNKVAHTEFNIDEQNSDLLWTLLDEVFIKSNFFKWRL